MGMACKIMGVILVIGSVCFFAKEANDTMNLRVKQLTRLHGILRQLESELKYLSSTLPECFINLSRSAEYPFDRWLIDMASSMDKCDRKDFSAIWCEYLGVLADNSALFPEDIDILLSFKDKLSGYDVEACVRAIEFGIVQIEERRKKLIDEINEKKKIVISLSLFVGLITVILLF